MLGGIVLTTAMVAAPGPMPSAQAACQATIQVANVSVTSTNTYNVRGTLNPTCGATTAYWDMDTGSGYSQTVDSWIFDNSTTAYAYYFPGIDPLGAYKAAGTGAFDKNFNSVPQAPAYFAIKLGTTIRIYGYRSGGTVYAKAYVQRYNPSLNIGQGGWQPSVGRYVSFEYLDKGWHVASGYRDTGSNGWTTYIKISAATPRQFRADVSQTSTIWNATSPAMYK